MHDNSNDPKKGAAPPAKKPLPPSPAPYIALSEIMTFVTRMFSGFIAPLFLQALDRLLFSSDRGFLGKAVVQFVGAIFEGLGVAITRALQPRIGALLAQSFVTAMGYIPLLIPLYALGIHLNEEFKKEKTPPEKAIFGLKVAGALVFSVLYIASRVGATISGIINFVAWIMPYGAAIYAVVEPLYRKGLLPGLKAKLGGGISQGVKMGRALGKVIWQGVEIVAAQWAKYKGAATSKPVPPLKTSTTPTSTVTPALTPPTATPVLVTPSVPILGAPVTPPALVPSTTPVPAAPVATTATLVVPTVPMAQITASSTSASASVLPPGGAQLLAVTQTLAELQAQHALAQGGADNAAMALNALGSDPILPSGALTSPPVSGAEKPAAPGQSDPLTAPASVPAVKAPSPLSKSPP